MPLSVTLTPQATMVRTSKRSSAAPQAAAPKKAKVDSATKAKCNLVGAALKASGELSGDVCKMLTAMLGILPGSPEVLRDDGTKCESRERVAKLFSNALSLVEAGITKKLGDAEAKVKGGDEERTTRESAVEAAQSQLKEQQDVVSEKQSIVDEAVAALKHKKEELLNAQAAQKAGDSELDSAAASLESLTGAKVTVDKLKAGSDDATSVKIEISALIELLGRFKLDPSMLTALPTVLSKAPDARGAFDAMVVSQLDAELEKHIARLQGVIQDGEADRAKRAEAVSAAHAAQTAASEARAVAEAALYAMQAEFAKREAALRTAQAALKDLGPELLRQAAAVDSAKVELASFHEGPLAAFTELTAPLPAPVAPEAEVDETERSANKEAGEVEAPAA